MNNGQDVIIQTGWYQELRIELKYPTSCMTPASVECMLK